MAHQVKSQRHNNYHSTYAISKEAFTVKFSLSKDIFLTKSKNRLLVSRWGQDGSFSLGQDGYGLRRIPNTHLANFPIYRDTGMAGQDWVNGFMRYAILTFPFDCPMQRRDFGRVGSTGPRWTSSSTCPSS